MNYDESNFSSILSLITFLSGEFPERQFLRIYAYPLFSIKQNRLLNFEILKHHLKCGFAEDIMCFLNTHFSSCMPHSINGGTIMPDGSIAQSCRGAMLEKGIVGNISKEGNNDNIYSWCTSLLSDKCYKCKYLPLCNEGCSYNDS